MGTLGALVLSVLVLLWGATLFFDWWGLGSTVQAAYRVGRPRTVFGRGRQGDRRIAGVIGMAVGGILVAVVLILWVAGV